MKKSEFFTGKVIKGHGVGKTIGFPTANLNTVPSEKKLKPGVYAGKCWISSSPFSGEDAPPTGGAGEACLVYFGPRYVFGETKNVFEVHILDFDQNIVGQKLQVSLEKFLRDPKKPKNLAELKKQLKQDKSSLS